MSRLLASVLAAATCCAIAARAADRVTETHHHAAEARTHGTERHHVHANRHGHVSPHRAPSAHRAPVAGPALARAAIPVPPPKPPVGRSTGLPIPRFASLRADEVNLRAGPGTQYPIDWVFKHQNMPVEIEREFDVWRLVEAPDGTKGWVHQATLVGARTFFIPDGPAPVPLRAAPSDTAAAAALLQPEVIGRLLRCDSGQEWCRVSVHGIDGYLKRVSVWGLLPDEAVGQPG